MISKCDTCKYIMTRVECNSIISGTSGTHSYCKKINTEIFGVIKECSDYWEKK